MSLRKKLMNTVLLGALALGGTSCSDEQKIKPPVRETKTLSGKITHIDEDSFDINGFNKSLSFKVEHLRIKTSDGEDYKLIFPGPSNYAIGDEVTFQYQSRKRVSYQELLPADRTYTTLQKGSFTIDGVVVRE